MKSPHARIVFCRPLAIILLILLPFAMSSTIKDLQLSGDPVTVTGNLEKMVFIVGKNQSSDLLYLTINGNKYELFYPDSGTLYPSKQAVYEGILAQCGAESPIGSKRDSSATYTTELENGALCRLQLVQTSSFPIIVGLLYDDIQYADPAAGCAAWTQQCKESMLFLSTLGIFLLMALIFIKPTKPR